MRDNLTPSKVLKYFAIVYVVCSLFYATGHLLGIGKSSSSRRASITPRSATNEKVLSVSELQERYHGNQQVTWGNTEGSNL